jgi:hypothetical protein
MLKIKNIHKLKAEEVLRHTAYRYYVEGVYEYPDHYQIHIRSVHKTIPDELLLLLRNKVKGEYGMDTHNYYTLYNSNEPQRRVKLTIPQISWKEMFIHNIETILKMNN